MPLNHHPENSKGIVVWVSPLAKTSGKKCHLSCLQQNIFFFKQNNNNKNKTVRGYNLIQKKLHFIFLKASQCIFIYNNLNYVLWNVTIYLFVCLFLLSLFFPKLNSFIFSTKHLIAVCHSYCSRKHNLGETCLREMLLVKPMILRFKLIVYKGLEWQRLILFYTWLLTNWNTQTHYTHLERILCWKMLCLYLSPTLGLGWLCGSLFPKYNPTSIIPKY